MAQYLGEHTALAEALGSVPRTCNRWFTTSGLQPLLGSMSPRAHNVYVHHAHAHMHTHTVNSKMHSDRHRKPADGPWHTTHLFL